MNAPDPQGPYCSTCTNDWPDRPHADGCSSPEKGDEMNAPDPHESCRPGTCPCNPLQRTEAETHAAYVAGTIEALPYRLAVSAFHADKSRTYNRGPCVCLACRFVAELVR